MIRRIVSGGQTGADRAALDAARELGIETGGWVPRGRWAEDGRVPDCYPNMKETDSADPAMRTEHNVRDSDGTVVFSHGEVSGGTKWTMEVNGRLRKPLLRLRSVEAAGGGRGGPAARVDRGRGRRGAQRRGPAGERGRGHPLRSARGAGNCAWRKANSRYGLRIEINHPAFRRSISAA